jgi:hypothetical protein
MTDSSNVYHQLTLCTLVGLALRELQEKGKYIFVICGNYRHIYQDLLLKCHKSEFVSYLKDDN